MEKNLVVRWVVHLDHSRAVKWEYLWEIDTVAAMGIPLAFQEVVVKAVVLVSCLAASRELELE